MEIASSPEAYIRYLELQGDNPYYSPGNIALAMFQKSDVTQFGTREKWKSLGRSVKDSEAGKGFQIFSRGTFGKGYVLAPAYDISQTYGREVKKAALENNRPEMEKALSTVLNYCVAPVVLDEAMIRASESGRRACVSDVFCRQACNARKRIREPIFCFL